MGILSLDSVGGASGDMLLAALVDLGADCESLKDLLYKISPEPIEITRTPASDRGLHGTRIRIGTLPAAAEWIGAAPREAAPSVRHALAGKANGGHDHDHGHGHDHPHDHGHGAGQKAAAHADATHHHAPHRGLPEILAILENPAIPEWTRHLASVTFRKLAEAEARIHNATPETIHFHEVGAADAIADIVGCCYAIEQLGVIAIRVGPLPAGCGTLHCAHGEMPNPAPATQLLLEGFNVIQTDEPFELVTPTGAALLAAWRQELAAPPAGGRIVRSGMGFGTRKLDARPNVLRATMLESAAGGEAETSGESLCVLETNLDDCNPQWLGEIIGRLLDLGALDAWTAPVTMKKGRPGIILGVLCQPGLKQRLERAIFLATPTFGIRSHALQRTALSRRHETVSTPFGEVRVKVGELEGRVVSRTPEFEDCAVRALAAGVTPRQVYEAAQAQAQVINNK